MKLRAVASPAPRSLLAARRPTFVRPARPLFRPLIAALAEGWTWYARTGGTPPAAEPAFPVTRRIDPPLVAELRPVPRQAPEPHLRFFPIACAAGGGCG